MHQEAPADLSYLTDGNSYITVFDISLTGTLTYYEMLTEPPTLERMQRLVRGYVELVGTVRVRKVNVQIFVNEEGLLHHLPFNAPGSAWVTARLLQDCHLVGPVVLLSGPKALWR